MSILSTISKIFESLTDFLTYDCSILNIWFFWGKTAELTLLTYNFLPEALEEGLQLQVDTVYTDLSKAFDKAEPRSFS